MIPQLGASVKPLHLGPSPDEATSARDRPLDASRAGGPSGQPRGSQTHGRAATARRQASLLAHLHASADSGLNEGQKSDADQNKANRRRRDDEVALYDVHAVSPAMSTRLCGGDSMAVKLNRGPADDFGLRPHHEVPSSDCRFHRGTRGAQRRPVRPVRWRVPGPDLASRAPLGCPGLRTIRG